MERPRGSARGSPRGSASGSPRGSASGSPRGSSRGISGGSSVGSSGAEARQEIRGRRSTDLRNVLNNFRVLNSHDLRNRITPANNPIRSEIRDEIVNQLAVDQTLMSDPENHLIENVRHPVYERSRSRSQSFRDYQAEINDEPHNSMNSESRTEELHSYENYDEEANS